MTDRLTLEGRGREWRAHTPQLAVINVAPPPESEDDYGVVAKSPGTPEAPPKFKLECWEDITFDIDEEWLIDGIIPKQGVGLLYGASQSLKSFVASHVGLCVARTQSWAGRKTKGAPVVYLAAEGAAGLRKRRQGYVIAGRAPAKAVDFALISATPNLGTSDGDCKALIATIEAAGIKPGMVIVDTVAKVIGGADENGQGMAQFLINAEALAQHFACFVLAVHHTGWNEDAKDRPRGWSGLPAALDVQVLSERKAGELFTTLTVQKLKDEPSGLQIKVNMERVVLGVSSSGREISTLIVNEIAELSAQGKQASSRAPAIPKKFKLLFAAISEAIVDRGQDIQAFGANGVKVRAVDEQHVRKLYFDRIAETTDPDEDPTKLRDRQRNGFKRAVKDALDAQLLIADDIGGQRFLWLP